MTWTWDKSRLNHVKSFFIDFIIFRVKILDLKWYNNQWNNTLKDLKFGKYGI